MKPLKGTIESFIVWRKADDPKGRWFASQRGRQHPAFEHGYGTGDTVDEAIKDYKIRRTADRFKPQVVDYRLLVGDMSGV